MYSNEVIMKCVTLSLQVLHVLLQEVKVEGFIDDTIEKD